jgi:hypothetical protein
MNIQNIKMVNLSKIRNYVIHACIPYLIVKEKAAAYFEISLFYNFVIYSNY